MAEKVLEIIAVILGSLIFGALPILWGLEMILSATWNKRYFSAGILLFVFHVPVKAHHTSVPSCSLLENNFKSDGCIRNTSLLFEALDANKMGFREGLLQLGRGSVMHGLLIFDAEDSRVTVKGFLDWAFLYFSLVWIIGGPLVWLLSPDLRDEPIVLVVLGYSIIFILLGCFCLIDYFRFSKVASFAAQAWQPAFTGGGV